MILRNLDEVTKLGHCRLDGLHRVRGAGHLETDLKRFFCRQCDDLFVIELLELLPGKGRQVVEQLDRRPVLQCAG